MQLCFTRESHRGKKNPNQSNKASFLPMQFFVHKQHTSNQNAFLFLFVLLCILLLMTNGFEDFPIEKGPQFLYTSIIPT